MTLENKRLIDWAREPDLCPVTGNLHMNYKPEGWMFGNPYSLTIECMHCHRRIYLLFDRVESEEKMTATVRCQCPGFHPKQCERDAAADKACSKCGKKLCNICMMAEGICVGCSYRERTG